MKAKNINLITALLVVSLLAFLPFQAHADSELQESREDVHQGDIEELRQMILEVESRNVKVGFYLTEDPMIQRVVDLGEPALEVLEPLLVHENDKIARTAAFCIRLIGGDRAREVLLTAAYRDEKFIPDFLSIKRYESREVNPAIVRYEMLNERPLDDQDDMKSVLMNETIWASDQQHFEYCEDDDDGESGSGERVWSKENGIWSVRQVKRKLHEKEKVPKVCFRTYISQNGTRAIVDFRAYYGPLNGWGRYAILEKIDLKWKLVFLGWRWIS